MARKRAPGGGRKPKGEIFGKRAVFSTRIQIETRQALERESARNKRSLSQEVEERLKASLREPVALERALGAPHTRA